MGVSRISGRVILVVECISTYKSAKISTCLTKQLGGINGVPYFLECFSPSNCIRPLIVFAQQSGLNVYCVRPHIVFARCSKRCARAIVIRKDNPLSGKVSINRKVKSVWMVRKKCQKKLQMQQKWQKEKKLEVQQKRGFLK